MQITISAFAVLLRNPMIGNLRIFQVKLKCEMNFMYSEKWNEKKGITNPRLKGADYKSAPAGEIRDYKSPVKGCRLQIRTSRVISSWLKGADYKSAPAGL